MKKRTLSAVLLVGALMLNGCGSKDAKVEQKTDNGQYVLFTLNDTNYYADDLLGFDSDKGLNTFISTNAGVTVVYEAIKDAITQAAQPITTTIQNTADLAYDDWEDELETIMSYGYSKKQAMALQLEYEGFSTIDEKKAALLLAEQKKALEKSFKKNKMEPDFSKLDGTSPLEQYVNETQPMIVSHILVKIADSSDIYTGAKITKEEAEKLGSVCNKLALSKKNSFAEVALDSDDGSYKYGGVLGIMDTHTPYVSEFKYGVYSSLLLENGNLESYRKALGISDTINDKLFGKDGVYANGKANTINVDQVCSALVSKSSDIGSQSSKDEDETKYTRNVLFNKYFNSPAVQYLTFSSGASTSDYPLAERSTNEKGYVTDENGNLIIVVRSEFGIHFITVNYNPLENSAKENAQFYSYQSKDASITSSNNYAKQENHTGYDTLADAIEARQEEVEDRVLNYLQGGYVGLTADETYMEYHMFLTYLNSTKLDIPNTKIKEAVLNHVNHSLDALDSIIAAYSNSNWEEYTALLGFDKSMRAGKGVTR